MEPTHCFTLSFLDFDFPGSGKLYISTVRTTNGQKSDLLQVLGGGQEVLLEPGRQAGDPYSMTTELPEAAHSWAGRGVCHLVLLREREPSKEDREEKEASHL